MPNWQDRGYRSGVDSTMAELLAAQLDESYTVDQETDTTGAVWKAHMEETFMSTKDAVQKACQKTGRELPANWQVTPHFRRHLRWADEQAAPFEGQDDGEEEESEDDNQPPARAQQPAAPQMTKQKGGGGKGGGGKGGGQSWRPRAAAQLRGSAARGRVHAVRSKSPHPSAMPGGQPSAPAASSQPPADDGDEDWSKPTIRQPNWAAPGQSSSASAKALGQPPAVGQTADQARAAALQSSQPAAPSTTPTPPPPPSRSKPAATPAEEPAPAGGWQDWSASSTWQASGRNDEGWQDHAGGEDAEQEEPEQSWWPWSRGWWGSNEG